MESQKELIHEKDWNNLIILDACRHDYFEEVYGDYLEGDLKKVQSKGTNTSEWLNKTFRDYYEFTYYYSANPHVNSLGVEVRGFKATNHFEKIFDLWNSDFDKTLNTVLPKTFLDLKLTEKRNIFHFMQPHRPWIVEPKENRRLTKRAEVMEKSGKKSEIPFFKVRRNVSEFLIRVLGEVRTKAVESFVKNDEVRTENGFLKMVEKIGARKALANYKKNIELPLEVIQKLVPKLKGSVVVTADHGEAFGENGVWGHPKGRHEIPVLKNIPWLEVKT